MVCLSHSKALLHLHDRVACIGGHSPCLANWEPCRRPTRNELRSPGHAPAYPLGYMLLLLPGNGFMVLVGRLEGLVRRENE